MTEVLFGEAPLPDEVKSALPVLKETPEKSVQQLLVIVLEELLGNHITEEGVVQAAQVSYFILSGCN